MEIISSKLFCVYKVSCPAWGNWEPTQQETMGKQFPIRHEAMVHHLNRKRLVKGFPSDMGLWCIISTGNDWRTVSCPAWG